MTTSPLEDDVALQEAVAKPQYVYVASSWRNEMQSGVVHALRAAGIDCYDFKNPAEGQHGFHWSDVSSEWKRGHHDGVMSPDAYLEALAHPVSDAGFAEDFAAMMRADAFVLVLPCGRSAHLELGWAVGAGKRTAVLLDDPVTPELMYKMVDCIAPSLFDLLGWLGVED